MFLSKLVSLNNAIKKIDDNKKVLGYEKIHIKDALGRVLAEDITSYHNSPPFNKSAMDGFAVIAKNTFGASNSVHKELKIIDDISAGSSSDKTVKDNEAVLIATGAPIPKGADAVIMKEFTFEENDKLTITSQVTPGENVVNLGEDIKKGEVVLKSNTLLRPQELGLISSAGYSKIKVFKKPNVKLIVTGSELVEPAKEIPKAKIINSNQFSISGMVKSCGANVDIEKSIDNFDKVREIILKASKEYDLVLTTGGTAISKADVVLDAVDDLGEILFHGVAIRPGRSMGAGIINGTLILNLSGQPVAAMGQFDMFARKYLFNLQGREYEHKLLKRKSAMKIPSQVGRTDFIRTFADEDYARHILNRGSGIIRSMVEANSYIILDENDEGCQKDDFVNVVFFDSMNW